jgi:anti-anti-sigma factor
VTRSTHDPAIVTIVARPDSPSAWIRLVGEIDTAAMPALADATGRLNGRSLRSIVIDLTAVTFACSTLANFLAALHHAHPEAELVLHHPSRMVLVILAITGLDDYVTVHRRPVGRNTRRRPGRWQAIDRHRGRTTDTGSSAIAIPDGP